MDTHERQDFASAGTTGTAGDIAVQAKEQAAQATDRIKSDASNRVRSELDTRSTQAADKITPYVEALNRAGHHLSSQGSSTGGEAAGRIATEIQQFSDYLRHSNADRFLGDVESFARRRPWAAGGIGLALGFLGARFLKASAETRYSAAQPPYTYNPAPQGMPVERTLPPHDMPLSREAGDTAVGGW